MYAWKVWLRPVDVTTKNEKKEKYKKLTCIEEPFVARSLLFLEFLEFL